MGARTTYPDGTFSWVDLATTEPAAARTFYRTLFGWKSDDRPVAAGSGYTVMLRDGHEIAGLYALGETERAASATRWNSHVSVGDVDAAAARATRLGGTIIAGPLDFGNRGRLLVVRDPQGAVVHLCQPGSRFGATCVNEPGCLTWNELATSDIDGAIAFYSRLFDWRIDAVTGMPTPYWVIRVGAHDNGGLRAVTPGDGGGPPRWLPYFVVEDVARAGTTAIDAGGSVSAGPIEQPKGRFSVLRDTQDATFLVFESTKLDP